MGDMKTPDFDDLLAAFDIPDATGLDAKETIPEGHDDTEGHLKPVEMCIGDISVNHGLPAPDLPAVSVIVKNTNRQESWESGAERERAHLGSLLQNGFRSSGFTLDSQPVAVGSYGKFETAFVNGDLSEKGIPQNTVRIPSFSQFSPISSPEPEDTKGNGIDDRPKQEERPYFPAASVFISAERSMMDSQSKLQGYSMFDRSHNEITVSESVNSIQEEKEFSLPEKTRTEENSKCPNDVRTTKAKFMVNPLPPLPDLQDLQNTLQNPKGHFLPDCNIGLPRHCLKTPSSKLSCLAALVALNGKKAAEDERELLSSRVAIKESVKVSPKVPKSPKNPRSPLEAVKRFVKQPDSPMSICSDSSGKASPSVTTGSPPAIPRVRIKTIKTSSGQIKRTVTSVLPDSDLEELLSPVESSPSQFLGVDVSSPKTTSTQLSQSLFSDIVFENGRSKTSEKTTSLVTLPSGITHVASASGSKKKVHSSVSPPKAKSVSQQLQRATPVKTANASNSTFLPKAVHLANLNLVPHSVAASVTARSATQRQGQPQLSTAMVCSAVPLVHQIKTAVPSSVLPCAAMGTLNRLLNSANPVPTYVPDLNPPAESNISLPAHGHRCLECGDSFGLEKSLVQHYSRRSVHVDVTCTLCSKALVFFNKCSLLAHAREHKSKGVIMQCTQLFLKPLPADQMFAPPAAKSAGPSRHQVPPASARSAKNPPVVPVMPLYPDKTIPHGLKCLECNKQMSDYRSLAGHYQRLSEEAEGLTCKICTMMLPNKCSYKAHQRVHAHKSPYCCPECGVVSRSLDIQKHVKENCLHYARKVGYKCPHCDMFYTSFYIQKSHIEEKHCEVFYKCSRCPVAFKSPDGCLMHMKNKHSESKVSQQVIYKCSCETVFKKKQLLFQHFHQNAEKLAACVFKCPQCALVFTHKQMLMQHFKGVHGGIFKAETNESAKPVEKSTSPFEEAKTTADHSKANHTVKPPFVTSKNNGPSAQRPKNNGPSAQRPKNNGPSAQRPKNNGPSAQRPNNKLNLKNAGWTCGDCLHWFPDRETYVSHMKTSHGKSVKRYPCRQCERSFNSSTSLRRHLRNDHSGKKRVYTCWYCTDKMITFTKHSMLKNHISLMHGIKNPDFSQMSKAGTQDPSKALAEGPVAKRSAEEALGGAAESSVPGHFPAKKPKPQFRCSKCGFSTEDRAEFQRHIPQHKANDGTSQCLHCGLCFTSQVALSRHLFIVHKVKDPEKEEEEEEEEEELAGLIQTSVKGDGLLSAEQLSSLVAGEQTRLHCDTCSEVFNCELAHSSHMQTHGLPCLTAVTAESK